MKKKKTWGQKFLTFLWWVCIPFPIFAGFRWVFSTFFLFLHRLFRSSSGVKKKLQKGYDDFFEGRYTLMEEYAENPSGGNIYWMLMTVLSIQETRYVSIETIRAFQALFLIDDRTAVMLLDTQEFTLIDKEGIEEELGITFGNYHDTDVRTKAYDKLIAKTYGRKDEESVYETPAPTTIGDLVKSQMCGDAACSPAVELTRCEPTNLKW